MQFGKQNQWTTWWYSMPSLVVLVFFVALLTISVIERYHVEREMAARFETASRELDTLQQRKKELKERVEYLEGERGVEEEIRKNFDVARPGEQVVIITGETKSPVIDEASESEEYPWYQFWR